MARLYARPMSLGLPVILTGAHITARTPTAYGQRALRKGVPSSPESNFSLAYILPSCGVGSLLYYGFKDGSDSGQPRASLAVQALWGLV